ncbi:MAG: hypothetical protein R3E99_14470 [Burkholderiaceae bacterium]
MSDSSFTINANQQHFIDWLRQQRNADVTASPVRFSQFKSEFLQRLDRLSLTIPNQAPDATTLFYSGMVDGRQAWQVAESLGEASNGKVITIGQTELGHLANNKEIFKDALDDVIDPDLHPTQFADITQAIWDRASHRLASEARGAVHTITPNAKADMVYASVELPTLMHNDRVTQIDGIGRTTLADVRDQLQSKGYTPERAMEVVRSRIGVQSAIDLEHNHGIRSAMHPELKQATEMLRTAAADMQGTAHGKLLALAAHNLDSLNFHPRSVATQADPARSISTQMDPEKVARIRTAIKAAGALGTAYGAYDAKHQVDAAIDTARSSREQWVRGGEEAANQTVRTAVTGMAATVGAIPGAAGGALTSFVTGPVGPMVGGLATGGAAAYGAEKLYEDSRLQQWSKTLGREVGQMGYDHVSKEGRLLRQVNGLQEDLLHATDPAERVRLQTRLDTASAAFGQEAERNGRTFEGRTGIDQGWEAVHARFPKVDKDDVNDALARHIDAGKPPADAVRGAFSDAEHKRYPRSLPHEPLENYRALGDAQLAQKHQQYVGEVVQGQRDVMALAASKDSHNNIDQGWPQALAQQRQAERVQAGMNGLWRDIGHLGAIREVYRERGLRPPELPAELRAREDTAAPTRSGRSALTPEQQRHHALAREQLAPGLTAQGHGPENMDRVCAAAVSHAQRHAHRGQVRAFHLSKDGRQIAVVQERAPIGEFSVHHALAQTSDWHLAQAHEMAQAAAKNLANAAVQTQAGAPSGPTPTRASVWA